MIPYPRVKFESCGPFLNVFQFDLVPMRAFPVDFPATRAGKELFLLLNNAIGNIVDF